MAASGTANLAHQNPAIRESKLVEAGGLRQPLSHVEKIMANCVYIATTSSSLAKYRNEPKSYINGTYSIWNAK